MTRLHPLHAPGRLLVLPNAWDAFSARLVEDAGADAIATTSAALAWAHGYADGENVPMDDVVRSVARIVRVVNVPVTVDLERGYAVDPDDAAEAVARVVEAGAEGVNLEDGGGPTEALAAKISAVRRRLGTRVFVNARTCVVLRGIVRGEQATDELLSRARIFADAGADGLFVPGLEHVDTIRAVTHGTSLPLNLMLVPGLPSLDRLRSLGVRRLSTGPRVAEAAYSLARRAARDLLTHRAYEPLLSVDLTYPQTNDLFARRARVVSEP